MTEFVVNIPAEKRKLKQLKWNIHIQQDGNQIQYIVLDNKNHLSKGTTDINQDESKLFLSTCNKLIQEVLNSQNEETRKHVQINLTSTSPYLINIARDWLDAWNKNNYENRPYPELLKELFALKKACKITASWSPQKVIV